MRRHRQGVLAATPQFGCDGHRQGAEAVRLARIRINHPRHARRDGTHPDDARIVAIARHLEDVGSAMVTKALNQPAPLMCSHSARADG